MLAKGPAPRRWPYAQATRTPLLASLLAADPLRLGAQAKEAVHAGVDALHIDVMDGHFVPNLAFSPAQVQALSRHVNVPLDVHLMMAEPLAWVQRFASAGAFGITVHAEVLSDLPAAIGALHAAGVAPGMSVKPNTDLAALLAALGPAVAHLSTLLVMGVAPGFGGQRFDPAALAQLAHAQAFKRANALPFVVVVDGGINEQTLAAAARAGGEAFVVGTGLFAAPSPADAVRALRRRASEATFPA